VWLLSPVPPSRLLIEPRYVPFIFIIIDNKNKENRMQLKFFLLYFSLKKSTKRTLA
jgi:hypothetical protein